LLLNTIIFAHGLAIERLEHKKKKRKKVTTSREYQMGKEIRASDERSSDLRSANERSVNLRITNEKKSSELRKTDEGLKAP